MVNDLLILLFYTSTALIILAVGGYIIERIPENTIEKWIRKIF